MAAGFPDIISLLGVWLGGRVARVPAERAFPSVGGHVQDWPRHRSTEASWSVPPIFQEPDIVRLVKEAVDEVLDREEKAKPRVTEQTVADKVEEVWDAIADADLADAIDRLFAAPSLIALAEDQRREAMTASAAAIRRAAEWREEDRLWSLSQARRRDDEEALLLLL